VDRDAALPDVFWCVTSPLALPGPPALSLALSPPRPQAFWGFCTQWVPGSLRHVRTARFPPEHDPWDVHPLNYAMAAVVYLVGWVGSGLLLLLIVALKVLLILLRAVSNHIYVFNVWAPLPWKKGFKCVARGAAQ
jgi:hypothetical protein